jgi:hypothetical protein
MDVSEETTDPLAEVRAMQKLAEAVAELDAEATARVLRWAVDRYGISASKIAAKGRAGPAAGNGVAPDVDNEGGNGAAQQFSSLAELHAAADPQNEANHALVAGYWFQFAQGQPDFTAQAVNSELNHLGRRIGNITTAFDRLKAQKPSLVIQLKKSGTTKQARKTYKLTAAGKQAVELLIGQSR